MQESEQLSPETMLTAAETAAAQSSAHDHRIGELPQKDPQERFPACLLQCAPAESLEPDSSLLIRQTAPIRAERLERFFSSGVTVFFVLHFHYRSLSCCRSGCRGPAQASFRSDKFSIMVMYRISGAAEHNNK